MKDHPNLPAWTESERETGWPIYLNMKHSEFASRALASNMLPLFRNLNNLRVWYKAFYSSPEAKMEKTKCLSSAITVEFIKPWTQQTFQTSHILSVRRSSGKLETRTLISNFLIKTKIKFNCFLNQNQIFYLIVTFPRQYALIIQVKVDLARTCNHGKEISSVQTICSLKLGEKIKASFPFSVFLYFALVLSYYPDAV